MLRSMKDLEGYKIQATDGTVGHVKDFYFDDEAWVVRYLIVDTGTWLQSRKVLISPIGIGHPSWEQRTLPVTISRQQVKDSPDIDTEKPVSRQHELGHLSYYGYQHYWGGEDLWGGVPYPSMMMPTHSGILSTPQALLDAQRASAQAERARHQDEDPHLRSCKAVIGYRIQATDGEIGHVQGLLVDDETWAIRYLVADTSHWWLGHRVLVAPQWIGKVSWSETTVSVDLTRQQVKAAPPYDAAARLDREQEVGLHKHYGRAGYWADQKKRATTS